MFIVADLVVVSGTKVLKSAVDAVLGEIVIAKVAVNGGGIAFRVEVMAFSVIEFTAGVVVPDDVEDGEVVVVPIDVVVSVGVMAVVIPVIFVMAGSQVVVAAFRVKDGAFIVVATGFISFIFVTEGVMVNVAVVL